MSQTPPAAPSVSVLGPLITQRLVIAEASEEDLPGMIAVARSNPWFLHAHEATSGEPESLRPLMVAGDIVAAHLDPLRHPLVIRKRGSDAAGSAPAVQDGDVIGWAETLDDHPRDHCPWIGLLEFHVGVQGRGFGREAALALIGWYRDRGATRIRLAVDDDNDRGAAFWRGLGFTFTERAPRVSSQWPGEVDVHELAL